VAFATFAAGAITAQLTAQCTMLWQSTGVAPGLDGTAYAATAWDPDGPGPLTERVVFGGLFAVAGGVPACNVAAGDPVGGSWSAVGPGFGGGILGGPVTALLALPNGDLVAGGPFTMASGAVGNHLARFDGTSWVAFGGLTPEAQGVTSLARLPNGDIAVGGWFTAAGTTALSRVGIWNGTSWASLGAGTDGPVYALAAMPNGDLVVGGYFADAGGVPASYIARWNGSSWAQLGSGVNGPVHGLTALPNGDVIALGTFTIAGSVAAAGVARWDGAAWSSLGSGLAGSGARGTVAALLPTGDLAVAGIFTQAGGAAADGIARWDGSAWWPLGSGVSGSGVSGSGVRGVRALAVAGGELLAGGFFGVAGGVPANRVARWNGTAWSALAPGLAPSNHVNALLSMPDRSVVAGGTFEAIGGVAAQGLARWNGASWSPLGSGPPVSFVHALAHDAQGRLLVAGNGPVARWDGAAWSSLGTTTFSQGRALAVLPSGDVVVGFSYSSALLWGIARWDGASWSDLGGGVLGEVHAMATLPNGDLLVGGALHGAGTTNVEGIARWNGASWSALGAGLRQSSGVAGSAFAILPLPNGRVIAGGAFATAGGVPANNIAEWNGTSWSPLGAGATNGVNGGVLELALLPNGDVLVAGAFSLAGGVPVNHVARWNGSTWSAVGAGVSLSLFSVPAFGGVRAIAADATGALFVGGGITAAAGQPSANLARLTTTCPAAVQPLAASCAGSTVHCAPPWAGGTWRAQATGLPTDALVAAVHGFATTNLPLGAVFATAVPGCTLHVQPDFVVLTMASSGAGETGFVVPNSASLAGTVFHHQMVPLALDATLAVTATDAWSLTVGVW
jgi:trimeric autotransporter adhesin